MGFFSREQLWLRYRGHYRNVVSSSSGYRLAEGLIGIIGVMSDAKIHLSHEQYLGFIVDIHQTVLDDQNMAEIEQQMAKELEPASGPEEKT